MKESGCAYEERLALLALCIALAGCSATPGGVPAAATTPAQIVSSTCTRCHALARIQAANHDAAGWEATVALMRSKGASLTDEQAKAVVEFLAGGGAAGL